MTPYVCAALNAEILALSTTTSGRACATFRSAASIGGFVAAGAISYDEAELLLLEAAVATGLPLSEASRTVRSGLKRGQRTPRAVPQGGWASRPLAMPALPPPRIVEPQPVRPPVHQVEELWNAAAPLTADAEVTGWFRYRYRDHAQTVLECTEMWDLARAIPPALRLPIWASSKAGPWTRTGHRLLFRLWGPDGRVHSLRARSIVPSVEPKSLVPARYQVKGLILADPLGVEVLSGATPDWWEPSFVISEGECDWLAWAGRQSDAYEQGPAYFGVEAGAWSQSLADLLPNGSRVVIRTDHDEPGERYAAQIAATLAGRCRLFRSLADEEVAS